MFSNYIDHIYSGQGHLRAYPTGYTTAVISCPSLVLGLSLEPGDFTAQYGTLLLAYAVLPTVLQDFIYLFFIVRFPNSKMVSQRQILQA